MKPPRYVIKLYFIYMKLEREPMNTESFKRIKKEKGINNYEIHKRSGVLESTLSEFERGMHWMYH